MNPYQWIKHCNVPNIYQCQYWWCETILQFLCMQPISLLFCNTDLSFELKKCFPYCQATLHISQVLSQMKFQLSAYFEHYKTFQIFHRLFIIISALNNKGFARFTVLNFQIWVALYSYSGEKNRIIGIIYTRYTFADWTILKYEYDTRLVLKVLHLYDQLDILEAVRNISHNLIL